MSRPVIRETRDMALIARLDRQCFPGDDPYRFTEAKWWVALLGGQPVAYAGARYWSPDNGVFLCRAGTLPAARGMGLQRSLIRVRLRWAKKIGASCVYTYTMPHNAKSARNLVRCGFLPWSPGRAWAGEWACYWVRGMG